MPGSFRTWFALPVLAPGLLALAALADAPSQTAEQRAGMPGLEAFVDGVVTAGMAQQKVAGAQVAIVRDGQVLLVKGYGIDRADPVRSVDPERSRFRLGSISKTFTWIALMQLAERGQIRLAAPINDHLPDDLDIPDDGFEQPIRIVDLMNHTAGFEDSVQRLFVAADAAPLSLREQLRRYRPHRVREPGRLMAYSNYGTALAGAIVAQVSGLDFETYVERNILAPLGMLHTTFREPHAPAAGLPEPMPAQLAEDRAENLEWQAGKWHAYAHEQIVGMAPAGAASSTAADMAQYMLALLDPERLARAGVLRTQTFAQLREPTFQGAPGLPAVHHGFFNTPLGSTTTLGFDNLSHGGATLHFMSFMVVVPDLAAPPRIIEGATTAEPVAAADGGTGSLGIFVTTNSASGVRLVQALPERILAEYFRPAATQLVVSAPDTASRLKQYGGQYRTVRRSYTKFEKVLSLPAPLRVIATPEGDLMVVTGGETARFGEIGTDLFRNRQGDATLAFARDDHGRITHLISGGGAFERIGWFQTLAWFVTIIAAAILTSLGVVVAAARRRDAAPAGAWARRAARVLTAAGVAWLAFLVIAIAWAMQLAGADVQDRFVYGYPQPLLKLALASVLVAAGLSVLALIGVVPAWREAGWTLGRKLRHTAAALVLVLLVATLLQWNVVGLRYF